MKNYENIYRCNSDDHLTDYLYRFETILSEWKISFDVFTKNENKHADN